MPTVGVIGAGTMGAGIAQIAAANDWNVLLLDVDVNVAEQAVESIAKRYARLVEKQRMTDEQRVAAMGRLRIAADPTELEPADLAIEAVVETLDVKVAVLRKVAAAARPETIFASNTSSLSITEIGRELGAAARTVGMHFFNPVPLMPLVEVIAGAESEPSYVERVFETARAWGKTPVKVKDTPGFIVNRVARGYYLEPLRMLGEGVAGIDELDAVLTRIGGFRMGPFMLMDLVGIDVNYKVSCSVYEQLDRPPRLKPHPIQQQLFESENLGRKTGQGAYSYAHEPPVPAVPVDRRSFDVGEDLYKGIRRFCDGATDEGGSITEQYIFARTLAAVINEAALAADEGIATEADIDTAMKLGTNYPKGPLAWAEQIGRRTCRYVLEQLNARAEDQRFTPAQWLRE